MWHVITCLCYICTDWIAILYSVSKPILVQCQKILRSIQGGSKPGAWSLLTCSKGHPVYMSISFHDGLLFLHTEQDFIFLKILTQTYKNTRATTTPFISVLAKNHLILTSETDLRGICMNTCINNKVTAEQMVNEQLPISC